MNGDSTGGKTLAGTAPELSICMAAYNESKNLPAVLARCAETLHEMGLTGEIVVTNDGSTDDTATVLSGLCQQYSFLRVLHNQQNSGYGYSVRKAVRASRGHLVATMDSDGQFDIGDLPILKGIRDQGFDIVTGYRIRKQDSLFRVIADRGLNLVIRLGFGLSLKDTNCALKLYTGDFIRGLSVESTGFSMPTEILIRAAASELRIGEAPVRHYERKAGQSTLHPFRTAFRMFAFLIYLRIQLNLKRRGIIMGQEGLAV